MRSLPEPSYSALRALDPKTGELRWEFKFPSLSLAGVTSTASGLVFAGDNEGNFAYRQTFVVLPHQSADLRGRRHHIHARWTAVRTDSIRNDTHRVCIAGEVNPEQA